MNNRQGYQKFSDALLAFSKFVFKIIMSNIYAALLNAPLLLVVLFYPINNDIMSWLLICVTSINIIPTCVILVRHFRDDLSIIKTLQIVYDQQGKVLMLVSLSTIILGLIIYVDIYFFKNLGVSIVEYIFSGLLIGLLVFVLNFIQVASLYKSNIKLLLLVTLAYTKELTISAFTVIMWVFVIVMLSLFVLPILSILIIGSSVAIHNWFSSKAIRMMLERVVREDIIEY